MRKLFNRIRHALQKWLAGYSHPDSEQPISEPKLDRGFSGFLQGLFFVKRNPGNLCIPKGYGVGWYDAWTDEEICFPLPFNLLAGLVYNVTCWTRFGIGDEGYQKARKKGFKEGHAEGYLEAQETQLDKPPG